MTTRRTGAPLRAGGASFAALRARQLLVAAADTRPIDEIRFTNLQRVNAKEAQAVMETKPGEPIDPKVLDADMRRLYGTGDFEHVNYRIADRCAIRRPAS